jgi:adenosylcobinamide-GDP ribazoletransferase
VLSAPTGRMGAVVTDRTGFLGAVQFLTRVPVRQSTAADAASIVVWFPVVGALVGAVVGGVVAGLGELVPASVAAAVGVLVGMLVTGAFHEDGLADTADAVAGGWTVERRLEILKDPRHGSYGVAALCGSIVLRVAAVAALGPAAAFAGLVAAHALGRGAAVATMGLVPVARPDGLGAEFARSVRPARAAAGAAVAVAIGALATGWWVAPLAVVAAAAAVIVTVVARRAFGGITGDILGAIEQVAEALVLVAVTALVARSDVWWA